VRGNHLHALFSKLRIEWIAIVGTITDQILRLRFDHVEVEGQLHEGDLMVISGVRGDCERQGVAIDYRHGFHAFSAPCRPNLRATSLLRCEAGIDKTSISPSSRSVLASFVSTLCSTVSIDVEPMTGMGVLTSLEMENGPHNMLAGLGMDMGTRHYFSMPGSSSA
jgi:hypothetical protein